LKGIAHFSNKPDTLVIMSSKESVVAIRECVQTKAPVIGIVDSDTS